LQESELVLVAGGEISKDRLKGEKDRFGDPLERILHRHLRSAHYFRILFLQSAQNSKNVCSYSAVRNSGNQRSVPEVTSDKQMSGEQRFDESPTSDHRPLWSGLWCYLLLDELLLD
jgi:hypothetical protein